MGGEAAKRENFEFSLLTFRLQDLSMCQVSMRPNQDLKCLTTFKIKVQPNTKGGGTMTTRILTPFETQVDRLFSDAVRSLGSQAREFNPPCNVWEDVDHFGIELALPGWKSEEIMIEAENGFVTVEGKRKEEVVEGNKIEKTYHVREVSTGAFSRSFRLPTNLEWDQATASFSDGVLTMAFPKRADAKPRRIAIQ